LQTEPLIILRKTPYGETSLIVSGLSPDFGKLDLVVKGARTLSPKSFPVIDLFREVQASFSDKVNAELHLASKLELLKPHDEVALVMENFELISRLGAFLLKNTAPQLPVPLTYDALKNVLENLCRIATGTPAPWSPLQCSIVIKITYLYENGLLPEPPDSSARAMRQQELIENIIEAGIEGSILPQCSDGYWPKLEQWLDQIIDYHQLKY